MKIDIPKETLSMIRKAIPSDAAGIEKIYEEHFDHEKKHGAYTVFKRGVYPTRAVAENAIAAGTMYVYETEEGILGSVILDKVQPVEYKGIAWGRSCIDDHVMVIHLLMVRPSMSGRGIGSSLVRYAAETAKKDGCEALRLDTGGQNTPAVSLYTKCGFSIVARAPKKVGDQIAHKDHLYLELLL